MTTIPTTEFEKIYSTLNEAQRTAVDTLEGPVMVVAGPGTGKTQVLSARIANILKKTDTNPSCILALTFTESSASNMRKRLVSMIGQTGYYVKIATFHSFCVEVIQSHPDYFSITRDSEPLTELERYQLFQELLMSLTLKSLRPVNTPLYYLKDVMRAISELKREGVTVEKYKKLQEKKDFLESSNERTIEKNKELLKIYIAYQKRLEKSGRYDFEDMIQLVVDAFEKQPQLLVEYQEKLLYFLVDEYQDTNNAQNNLLKQLTSFWGEHGNVFVVGDPHQSIFRFQGASIENMISFIKWYPNATVVRLDTGYRSPQSFYDAASGVISNNTSTNNGIIVGGENILLSDFINKPVLSAISDEGRVIVQETPSQLVEHFFIAESIAALLKRGVGGEKIAVLYRHNSDAELLRETLEKWGILYELDSGDDILKATDTSNLLSLLSIILAIREGGDDAGLFEVLCLPWFNLDIATVIKVSQVAGKSKQSLYELLKSGYGQYVKKCGDLPPILPIEFETIVAVVNQISTWGIDDVRMVFPAWFEKVITESGYLDYITHQENKISLLTNISTLFREIKGLSASNNKFKLKNFTSVVETLSHFKIELRAEDLNIVEGAVKLSTIHKAKGQEWDHVFLMQCIDSKWGNVMSRNLIPLPSAILQNTDTSKRELNEDERRLFYVAITRARREITISYPLTIISQTTSRSTTPSMFISEIPSQLVTKNNDFTTPEKAMSYMETFLRPTKTFFYEAVEDEYFKKLVENFTMSPTALNTYLKDTQEFVRNILLKIPRAKSPTLAFGSAVHKTLEEFYKHLQETDQIMSFDSINKIFESYLTRELLTDEDFKRRLIYGRDILRGYYEANLKGAKKPYLIERFFGGRHKPVMLEDIPLSGRVDRIDWVDKANKTVRVIDYKTGRSKTMGDIEGKTKSSPLSQRELELPEGIRGAYKRQILFYKLLTQLDRNFDACVIEGEFDFIEPDKTRGVFVKRSVKLLDSEVEQLKQVIVHVMGEIRNLDFLK